MCPTKKFLVLDKIFSTLLVINQYLITILYLVNADLCDTVYLPHLNLMAMELILSLSSFLTDDKMKKERH